MMQRARTEDPLSTINQHAYLWNALVAHGYVLDRLVRLP